MTTAKSVPCRLYAILAREAPVAVIFRRGPSKRVQIILWNTADDTFTPGQWFYGRIYEHRCDLSPDGKLMVYLAASHRSDTDDSYTNTWTAISKPPYLTALALWPNGDSWAGGGQFDSNSSLWLNHPPDRIDAHNDHQPGRNLTVTHNDARLGEDDSLYSRRTFSDGWKVTLHQVVRRESERRYVTDILGLRERKHPTLPLKLLRNMDVTGLQPHYRFAVLDADGNQHIIPATEWADWDQRGRLVYAHDGKIFAVATDAIGHAEPQELIDLNPNTPAPMETAAWAKVW